MLLLVVLIGCCFAFFFSPLFLPLSIFFYIFAPYCNLSITQPKHLNYGTHPTSFWLIPHCISMRLGYGMSDLFKSMMKAEDYSPHGWELQEPRAPMVLLAYLKQQYKVVLMVLLSLRSSSPSPAYGFNTRMNGISLAFLTGGFFSGLAGFFGMKTATYACRERNAARNGLNNGLKIAFRSGAVMGLVVCWIGSLLDYSHLVHCPHLVLF